MATDARNALTDDQKKKLIDDANSLVVDGRPKVFWDQWAGPFMTSQPEESGGPPSPPCMVTIHRRGERVFIDRYRCWQLIEKSKRPWVTHIRWLGLAPLKSDLPEWARRWGRDADEEPPLASDEPKLHPGEPPVWPPNVVRGLLAEKAPPLETKMSGRRTDFVMMEGRTPARSWAEKMRKLMVGDWAPLQPPPDEMLAKFTVSGDDADGGL